MTLNTADQELRQLERELTAADIIRAAIPDADDELCDFIVWARTPFPMTRTNAREFFRAASQWRRAQAKGNQLCDRCDRIAEPDHWQCAPCRDALQRLVVESRTW